MWCWRRMERISWTDHVRNEEVLLQVNEQRNILHEIRKRKANWIGHILRRNCLLKQVIEGKIKGEIEVIRRQGRRRKKLLDDLKDRRGYSHLKKEALDRNMWRDRFGRGFVPVVRQTTALWWCPFWKFSCESKEKALIIPLLELSLIFLPNGATRCSLYGTDLMNNVEFSYYSKDWYRLMSVHSSSISHHKLRYCLYHHTDFCTLQCQFGWERERETHCHGVVKNNLFRIKFSFFIQFVQKANISP